MNPIKDTDIYQHGGEFQKLIKDLTEANAQYDKLMSNVLKKVAELEKKVGTLNETRASGREEIAETTKQAEELNKRYNKLNASYTQNALEIAKVKNAQRQLNQINRAEAKLLTAKEGSYEALSAQYSLNKIALNKLSAEERKATVEGRKLVEETRAIYEEMKVLQAETGKTSLNVGNYQSVLEGLPGVLNAASKGTEGFRQTLSLLAKNPIILILGTLGTVLGVLFNAFRRSEKGAQLFAKVTGVINGVLSQLTKLAVSLADKLSFAFNNPKEAIMQLGEAIFNGVVKRFQGLIGVAVNTGKAIAEAFKGNFGKARQAAEDALFSIQQTITGLDKNDVKELADAISDATEEAIKQTNAFIELEQAKRNARKANRSLVRSIEELTTAEELNNAIADDTTKSLKERNEAAEQSRVILEKRARQEIQLARNNLSLLNTELRLRRAAGEEVEDLADQQLEAYRSLAAAERQYTLAVRSNERTRAEIRQDELERDLDILIDGFDNQKTINERRLRDSKLTFEERAKILDETNRLADRSFEQQIATIEKFTKTSIDANELIGESDAVVLNQKIRNLGVSEIIEGRVLEIVRDRKLAEQELAQAAKDLAKARTDALIKERTEAQRLLNQRKAAAQEQFEQRQALSKSEFDLLKTTEKEKAEFQLKAERDRLTSVLALNIQFGGQISKVQFETIKNQIALIDKELAKLDTEGKSIFDLFGLKVDEEQKAAFTQAISFIKDQLTSLIDKRLEAAQAAVQAANEEVAIAQRQLEIEIQNREDGEASEVENARRRLERERRERDEALREQERAARAQRRIQTIEQSINLATASTKIFNSLAGLGPFGVALAVGAIGTMFGTFIASKIRASQLARQNFREGTFEILGGGKHGSGHDTFLGFQTSEGKSAYGEQGEAHIVVPAIQTSKQKKILPDVAKALINGSFAEKFGKLGGHGVSDISVGVIGSSGSSVDMGPAVDVLSDIRDNTSIRTYTDGRGRTVEVRGNLTVTNEN